MPLRPILHFFKPFLPITLLIDGVLLWQVMNQLSASVIMLATLGKIIAGGIVALLSAILQRTGTFYYQNLGIPTKQLFGYSMAIDLTIWVIGVGLIYMLA